MQQQELLYSTVEIWDIPFAMFQVLSARDKMLTYLVKYYSCHNSNHKGQTDGHCCDIATASINFQHVAISLSISFLRKKNFFLLQQHF